MTRSLLDLLARRPGVMTDDEFEADWAESEQD